MLDNARQGADAVALGAHGIVMGTKAEVATLADERRVYGADTF